MSHELAMTNMKTAPRAWGRSFVLASLLHGTVAAWMLWRIGVASPLMQLSARTEPLVQSEFVTDDSSQIAASTIPEPLVSPDRDTAIEPGFDYIRQAAQSILTAARKPAGPSALSELERRASQLEQLSTPAEIERISESIRNALGVPPIAVPIHSEPATPGFDFDHCVVTDSQRFESPKGVEIRETLRDHDGRMLVIVYARRVNERTGEVQYTQREFASNNDPSLEFRITQEEFEEAEARQRPYQIINRFGLLRKIHDEAVLPLLDKWGNESPSAPNVPNSAIPSPVDGR